MARLAALSLQRRQRPTVDCPRAERSQGRCTGPVRRRRPRDGCGHWLCLGGGPGRRRGIGILAVAGALGPGLRHRGVAGPDHARLRRDGLPPADRPHRSRQHGVERGPAKMRVPPARAGRAAGDPPRQDRTATATNCSPATWIRSSSGSWRRGVRPGGPGPRNRARRRGLPDRRSCCRGSSWWRPPRSPAERGGPCHRP